MLIAGDSVVHRHWHHLASCYETGIRLVADFDCDIVSRVDHRVGLFTMFMMSILRVVVSVFSHVSIFFEKPPRCPEGLSTLHPRCKVQTLEQMTGALYALSTVS